MSAPVDLKNAGIDNVYGLYFTSGAIVIDLQNLSFEGLKISTPIVTAQATIKVLEKQNNPIIEIKEMYFKKEYPKNCIYTKISRKYKTGNIETEEIEKIVPIK